MTIMYGIPNCDSIKKAQKWLIQHDIPYTFHDYRKDGLDAALIRSFLTQVTWQELLNKRSSSYRTLSELQKEQLNEETAIALFVELPTLIKRPLIIHQDHYMLGFKAENYHNLFVL